MQPMEYDTGMISMLRAAARPEYVLGFVNCCLLLEQSRAVPETEQMMAMLHVRDSIIKDQLAQGLPTGLPAPELWWTDVDPEVLHEDESEAVESVPLMEVFLLNSNVEPFARWAVRLHEEDAASFFHTRGEAAKAVEAAQEDYAVWRKELIESCHKAMRDGDKALVGRLLDEADGAFEHRLDFMADTLTIEGETSHGPRAEPQVPRPVTERTHGEILTLMRAGRMTEAERMAHLHNLKFEWQDNIASFNGNHFKWSQGGAWTEVSADDIAAAVAAPTWAAPVPELAEAEAGGA